jgi:hypothetical protein
MEPIQDDIETVLTPEYLAQMFHETYERLAPVYTYETRRESRVPWAAVPEPNRSLMLAVATEVLDDIKAELAPALDRLVAERDSLVAYLGETADAIENHNVKRKEVAALLRKTQARYV